MKATVDSLHEPAQSQHDTGSVFAVTCICARAWRVGVDLTVDGGEANARTRPRTPRRTHNHTTTQPHTHTHTHTRAPPPPHTHTHTHTPPPPPHTHTHLALTALAKLWCPPLPHKRAARSILPCSLCASIRMEAADGTPPSALATRAALASSFAHTRLRRLT